MILEYTKKHNLSKLHAELLELEELQPVPEGDFLVSIFSLQGNGDDIKVFLRKEIDINLIVQVIENHAAI